MLKLKPKAVFDELQAEAPIYGWKLTKFSTRSVCVSVPLVSYVVVTCGNSEWRVSPSFEKVPIWYGNPAKIETLIKHILDRSAADAVYAYMIENKKGD